MVELVSNGVDVAGVTVEELETELSSRKETLGDWRELEGNPIITDLKGKIENFELVIEKDSGMKREVDFVSSGEVASLVSGIGRS